MKYIPLNAKNRSYVSPNWNKKIIRGLQCVLLATNGIISPRREFFEAAFGSTYDEFLQIVMMPEQYIINRRKHSNNGAYDWYKLYSSLTQNQRKAFMGMVGNNKVDKKVIKTTSSQKIKSLLSHYIEYN